MAIEIPQLNYGTVIGRFLVELADSDDADLNPDVYPASGYIVFTPGTSFATVRSATPDPATLFPQKVIGVLDANGYLYQAVFNGPTGEYSKTVSGDYVPSAQRGVRLQATDDSDLNPQDWTWTAEFHFRYNKTAINYPSFNFHLPSNTTVDLAAAKPVSSNSGEYTITGPQGPRGEQGDPGPATTLSVGTVTTRPTGTAPDVTITGASPSQTINFGLPQGPVGPSGGPIPAGGSAGDSVIRGSSTSSEWRFTDGYQDNLFPNGSLEYANNYKWNSVMTMNSSDIPAGYSTSLWCPEGTGSISALTHALTPIVSGDDYIMEVWVKANKPNSNFYIEMRDQAGAHAGEWTWIEGGTNPASSYPIGQYTVPTEWTKIKSRGKLTSTATQIRPATFYFNHTSGTEKTASIGIAGFRVYRAPSISSLSSDVQDILPTVPQKSLLDSTSSSAGPSTLAQRDPDGGIEFSSVTVASSSPASDNSLTSKKYVDDLVTTGPDLISGIKNPLIIAHRGGLTAYPEESMEGFIASSESGYMPEMDIQFLSDGVPVLCHDATVNRTMSGGTGAVTSFNSNQWRKLRINPIISEGKSARPVFFEEVLDRLGGKILLVPEIKTAATTAQVQQIIDMVKAKRLQKAVLLQTFTWTSAQQIANAGLPVLFLMSSLTQSAATIKAAGIDFVGPSKTMPVADLNSLISAGLKVIPYSVNTPTELKALPTGISGFFSDDPWNTSGELQASHTGWWTQGTGWPAKMITVADTGTATTPYDGTSFIKLRGGGIHVPRADDPSLVHISLDHLIGGSGLIDRPLTITARFVLGRRSKIASSTVGFTIYRNTSPDIVFADTAWPGQNGFTFAARRNGAGQIWKYENGAGASSLISNTTFWSGVADNTQKELILTLEMAASWMAIYTNEGTSYLSTSDPLAGPFRAMLRVGGTEATIYDVSVGPYINSSL